MAERRVLALGTLDQPAGDRGRPCLRRAAFELLDVAEPERLEVRQIEPADGSRDVSERVGALVAEFVGVRKGAGADAIEDDYTRSGHRAILGSRWTRSWTCSD